MNKDTIPVLLHGDREPIIEVNHEFYTITVEGSMVFGMIDAMKFGLRMLAAAERLRPQNPNLGDEP